MAAANRFARWIAVLIAMVVFAEVAEGHVSTPRSSGAPTWRAGIATERAANRLLAPRATTFISLWPACACGRHTMLEQFSLSTGRRLGPLAKVPVRPGEAVAPPASRINGTVLLTFSSGPRCAGPPGGGPSAGPCEPLTNSCASRIESLNPAAGSRSTLLSLPASVLVTDALPSPDGRRVVMQSATCQTSFFNMHLVVRDLRSRRQWSIGSDAAPCHAIGRASWSDDGSRLVFPYGPSIQPAGAQPSTNQFCTEPQNSRLVIISSGRASSTTSWKLINADKGCSFKAAAFDRLGVAAAEGCNHGHPLDVSGNAYLLQLNRQHRVIARVKLEPGWEAGLVSTEPRTGNVLVTQDQPANQSYPERDWVWEFDGHRLHPVGHYPANDAAQVLAVAW